MSVRFGAVVDAAGRQVAAARSDDAPGVVHDLGALDAGLFGAGTLDAFLAAGPEVWQQVISRVTEAPAVTGRPVLAFTVADYTDFFASRHHATNAGRIFRPNGEPLPSNWLHLPVGYHGRSATVVASGTPVRRPRGVLGPDEFAPSRRLDFEAELGFVVGVGGSEIAVADADRHVFGVCLLNDWSARDIQGFETTPLGPFLGKSFATSVASWITPLSELRDARRPHEQDPEPLPHLRDHDHRLAIDVEIRLNDVVIGRPHVTDLHWTYAQMLTHLTSNGARVRTGDLYGSGTISGPSDDELGCLLELTGNGARTIEAGGPRSWLEDGDELVVTARAGAVELDEVRGRVMKP